MHFFKTHRYAVTVLLIYTTILTISEVLYRYLFDITPIERLLETAAINLLFIGLFYFSQTRIIRIIIACFFTLSILTNNVHYAVYQSWINSVNYLLAFTEANEAWHAGQSLIGKVALPLLYGLFETTFFLSLFYVSRKKTPHRMAYTADTIFIILILYIAIRAFVNGFGHGITPDTGYSRLKSHYYSFGYFIGKLIPDKLIGLERIPYYKAPPPVRSGAPKIRNIIIIMGESDSATHHSYFGYTRNTSPFFHQLVKQHPNAIIKPTYSGGFMTAVSLPLFFNAIPKPNGLLHINKGISNMFRLAKEQGFVTEFHSSQPETEMEIMNLIGGKWIDDVTFPTLLGYDKKDGMPDNKILPYLYRADLSQGRHLIVLHQRGSHMPYGQYLPKSDRHFSNDTLLDNYDSTIYHTNLFIQKVFNHLMKQPQQDWLLVFTSDHGQYVNDKIANQGTNHESSYLVPTLVYSPNEPIQNYAQTIFGTCKRIFHLQLSHFLINTLGYNLSDSGCSSGLVTGNMLSGDAGWLLIKTDGSTEYVHPPQ